MSEGGLRPRILLVTRNLPPLIGGMEKLNQRLVAGLAAWAEVEVVGPAGCRAALAPARAHEVPPGPLWKFLPAAGAAAVRAAVGARPHLVL
ncbi:MAG TPA: glycosyltransferase family 1 protein, partial [Xanthomonadaceae bacterium]|nr:glycosyltransferase family 1 protein [Xanthomonadaceae bacterium]